MVELVAGNLLQADVEALVNTVNTVGAMGKGIALQFKQAYPANFDAYRKAVERGEIQTGRMFVLTCRMRAFSMSRSWASSPRPRKSK